MRVSNSLKHIMQLCQDSNLCFEKIMTASKTVLNLYRKVMWAVDSRANFMVCESKIMYGATSESAYLYLSTFAPDDVEDKFSNRVSSVMESKLILLMIYDACLRLKRYPEYGNVYYEIIYNYYISDNKKSDQVCMNKVCLERTVYYQRKKEAIVLMGVILWSYSIPTAINELKEGKSIEDLMSI